MLVKFAIKVTVNVNNVSDLFYIGSVYDRYLYETVTYSKVKHLENFVSQNGSQM